MLVECVSRLPLFVVPPSFPFFSPSSFVSTVAAQPVQSSRGTVPSAQCDMLHVSLFRFRLCARPVCISGSVEPVACLETRPWRPWRGVPLVACDRQPCPHLPVAGRPHQAAPTAARRSGVSPFCPPRPRLSAATPLSFPTTPFISPFPAGGGRRLVAGVFGRTWRGGGQVGGRVGAQEPALAQGRWGGQREVGGRYGGRQGDRPGAGCWRRGPTEAGSDMGARRGWPPTGGRPCGDRLPGVCHRRNGRGGYGAAAAGTAADTAIVWPVGAAGSSVGPCAATPPRLAARFPTARLHHKATPPFLSPPLLTRSAGHLPTCPAVHLATRIRTAAAPISPSPALCFPPSAIPPPPSSPFLPFITMVALWGCLGGRRRGRRCRFARRWRA